MSEGFGAALRRLREARTVSVLRDGPGRVRWHHDVPLSQNQLALRAQVNVAAINKLERGINGTPKRETVHALAAALGLDPIGTARLLVAAGYWPWPDADDDTTALLVALALAVLDGDYRPLSQVVRESINSSDMMASDGQADEADAPGRDRDSGRTAAR